MLNLQQAESPYISYAYAYPHKTAYGVMDPPVPLHQVWENEDKDALFLYLHIPFCEMRCGFCNLFTTANPDAGVPEDYLQAMQRQALQVREALGKAHIARMAVGGGTPTYLSVAELHAMFDIAEHSFDVGLGDIPLSVETSPLTSDSDRLAALKQRGVSRISIGVQSFIEEEARAAGRPQRTRDVTAALDRIRGIGFPTLNIDLIYGLAGQSVSSWLHSVGMALQWAPEEIYLYPLYVRPLTGLGKRDTGWDDQRLACYRAGRDYLLAHGYEQISMRLFRSVTAPPGDDGTAYCCQDDGMIGLGCGARSYTRTIHYSSEYAVGRGGIRAILAHYMSRSDEEFAQVDYGYRLDVDDQRRRYVIKSILRRDGLSLDAYRRVFNSDPLEDFSELGELQICGYLHQQDGHLCPTPPGLEHSDLIGPWLYSDRVRTLSEAYELR